MLVTEQIKIRGHCHQGHVKDFEYPEDGFYQIVTDSEDGTFPSTQQNERMNELDEVLYHSFSLMVLHLTLFRCLAVTAVGNA